MANIAQLETLFEELQKANNYEDKVSIIEKIKVLASQVTDFQTLGTRLLYLLKHPNADVRSRFAEFLGDNKAKSFASAVVEALRFENDENVKIYFVDALQKMNDSSVVPYLIEILNEPIKAASEVRLHWHVADALGVIGDISAADALVRTLVTDYGVLEPSSSDLREAAADALATLRSSSIVERLIAELQKETLHPMTYKDEAIRSLIAKTLGDLKLEIAIHPLISLLKQSKYDVRAAAAEALGNYGGDEVIEALNEAMDTENEEVRFCASLALKKINNNLQ